MEPENFLTATPGRIAEALERLTGEVAVAVDGIAPEGLARLTREAEGLEYRPARPVIGEGPDAVYQDFDLTLDFPAAGGFHRLTAAVETLLNDALAQMDRLPLAPPIGLNDLILQRYPPGSAGITPHRDHVRYTGLVVIAVLAGDARFGVCDDRRGANARIVDAPPGSLLLMRAPGFAGHRDRPFHFLNTVTGLRYSFGMRHDSRKG